MNMNMNMNTKYEYEYEKDYNLKRIPNKQNFKKIIRRIILEKIKNDD